MTVQRGRIIYVNDALCGWCYGFSPVITAIHEKYKDELDFEVISGGMVTGSQPHWSHWRSGALYQLGL